jgi:hypothetical protein
MAGSLTCSELATALERERATSRKALELVLEQAHTIIQLNERIAHLTHQLSGDLNT